MFRFKGLPIKTVDTYELPDVDAYPAGLDPRLATPEFPTDLGRMSDPDARLQKGQEVNIRETVPAGEHGAGPIAQEMVVVEWDLQEYTNLYGETDQGYMRAMSFTPEQFETLFEEVK